jgi:two-component system, chemotaxis family, chemotaxis protein CheY
MPRVLSVGQCGFDHGKIARGLGAGFGAEVVAADTFPEAVSALRGGRFDLVLVNRVTDDDGTDGLDLIRTLKADPTLAGMAVMLVSNRSDAQQEAEALGALPGFGKADLGTSKARQCLEAVLRDPSAAPSRNP